MSRLGSQGLVSPSDIAEMAGVSRGAVSNWRKRHVEFPQRIAGTDASPLFDREEVVSWLGGRGYAVKRPAEHERWWGEINAIRDQVPPDRLLGVVLCLVWLRIKRREEFDRIASAALPEQLGLISDAVADPTTPGFSRLNPELPRDIMDGNVNLQPVIAQISEAPTGVLPAVMDTVLERFQRLQGKTAGEFGLIGSRTSSLLSSLVPSNAKIVYDPACGIGSALLQSADEGLRARFVGSDSNREALAIAKLRAGLRGIEADFVLASDVLSKDPVPGLEADAVIAEPPLGARWDPSGTLADPRYGFGTPGPASGDLAWIQHCIAHLAPLGKAYVLTPPGSLYRRGGGETKVRANLLAAGCVEAIVSLPGKMLPQTAIPLALWVLRAPTEPTKVLFIDASTVGDVENEVAAWLEHSSRLSLSTTPPHAEISVSEILAADSALNPSRWVHASQFNAEIIEASYNRASAAVEGMLERIRTTPQPSAGVCINPKPRIVTVGELIRSGVVRVVSRDLRATHPDASERTGLVTASRIRGNAISSIRVLRKAEVTAFSDGTLPGDVLITTAPRTAAAVDDCGGHFVEPGIEVIRVVDKRELDPRYLAFTLGGSWNRKSVEPGNRRVRLRDLEVPIMPPAEQAQVVDAYLEMQELRKVADQISTGLHDMENALRDAVRFSVAIGKPNPSATGSLTDRGKS